MNLFILAAVVACVARTVTQEEVFREFKEWCVHHSKTHRKLAVRKLCYLFTCEYCFSHWVTAGLLVLTGYRLEPWGFLVTLFTLVWLANVYMGLFAWLKQAILLTRWRAVDAHQRIHTVHTPEHK